jgi:hypothetical protein
MNSVLPGYIERTVAPLTGASWDSTSARLPKTARVSDKSCRPVLRRTAAGDNRGQKAQEHKEGPGSPIDSALLLALIHELLIKRILGST